MYSQLEMSRVIGFDPKIRNIQNLVPKNTISYRMSPPYVNLSIPESTTYSQTIRNPFSVIATYENLSKNLGR